MLIVYARVLDTSLLSLISTPAHYTSLLLHTHTHLATGYLSPFGALTKASGSTCLNLNSASPQELLLITINCFRAACMVYHLPRCIVPTPHLYHRSHLFYLPEILIQSLPFIILSNPWPNFRQAPEPLESHLCTALQKSCFSKVSLRTFNKNLPIQCQISPYIWSDFSSSTILQVISDLLVTFARILLIPDISS